MNAPDRLFDYAAEVMSFDYKDATPAVPPAAPEAGAARRMAERCAAAFARSGRERLALLGLASGAVAGELARLLPPGALVVCEQDLGLARAAVLAGRLDWRRAHGPAALALDASPWALLLLLDRAGISPSEVMVLPNPELPPEGKAKLRTLELLLARSVPVCAPGAAPLPRLSAAAILSPDEPCLPEFFAQFPAWLTELVLVWDADAVPDMALPPGLCVRQTARRLERDFSAQREAMLAQCRGDWVVYLDGDETLSAGGWAALPGLCAVPGVGGWHFPRLTAYPDPERVLTGFGLWPDLQLRLFARAPELRFFNRVHERLAGIAGRQGLALDVEIFHASRLRKTDAELARKLEGFNQAGEGRVRHALSTEYPSVARALLAARTPGPRGLLLPLETA